MEVKAWYVRLNLEMSFLNRICCAVLLVLLPALLVAEKIRIRSTLSPDRITTETHFSNRIIISVAVDTPTHQLLADDLECQFPGDPGYRGVSTLRSSMTERIIVRNGKVVQRLYRIIYVYAPQYPGSVTLKPFAIHLISNGRTNTVMSPYRRVVIERSSSSSSLIWILVSVIVIGAAGYVVVQISRRRSGDSDNITVATGGNDGE